MIPEDGQVILSRKIMNGKSINKINGETVTLNQLRETAALLIDVHGQHEHQSLLQKKKHLEILDEYAKEELQPIKEKLAAAYTEWKNLQKNRKTPGWTRRAACGSCLFWNLKQRRLRTQI